MEDTINYQREFRRYLLSSKKARLAAIYHKQNKEIYTILLKYSLQAKESGLSHFGIESIFNRVRWFVTIEKKNYPYKMNNNHKAFYSRKLMAENKQLEGFFQIRETK